MIPKVGSFVPQVRDSTSARFRRRWRQIAANVDLRPLWLFVQATVADAVAEVDGQANDGPDDHQKPVEPGHGDA